MSLVLQLMDSIALQVVSDRMKKSVLVAVKRLKAFPKYRVTLEKARKFMASPSLDQ